MYQVVEREAFSGKEGGVKESARREKEEKKEEFKAVKEIEEKGRWKIIDEGLGGTGTFGKAFGKEEENRHPYDMRTTVKRNNYA